MYVTYFCTDAYKSFLDCFFPEDVQYSSLPTLSKDVLRTMLPDIEINEISLNEGAEVFVIWFSRLITISCRTGL